MSDDGLPNLLMTEYAGSVNPITGLNPAQEERLSYLIEECSEVIKIASKIKRHGYESYNPFIENGPSNRDMLEEELNQVILGIGLLHKGQDIRIDGSTMLSKLGEIWKKKAQWFNFQTKDKMRALGFIE